MTSAIAILERLLENRSENSKEHILETASPRLTDVENRMDHSFDALVKEISTIFGVPDFANSKLTGQEKVQNILPKWSEGTARNGGVLKTMRLSYWKRDEETFYIALRTECDTRNDRNLYYDLVLGARRRTPGSTPKVEKLRNAKEHWLSRFIPFFTGR